MAGNLDGFVGRWELDPTTLHYERGRPGLRAIYTITRTGEGLTFDLDADDADGKPMHFVYGGKVDGVDRSYEGYPVTVSLALLEDGSIESVAKKDGVAIDRWTRTLVEDGQALLICQHKTDEAGNQFRNAGLYRKTE
ncbi:MAG: hypothetical protein WBQ94_24290 [Terracidiphilus sp.]